MRRFSSVDHEGDDLEQKQNAEGVKRMRPWTGSREGVAGGLEGLWTHRILKITAAAMAAMEAQIRAAWGRDSLWFERGMREEDAGYL